MDRAKIAQDLCGLETTLYCGRIKIADMHNAKLQQPMKILVSNFQGKMKLTYYLVGMILILRRFLQEQALNQSEFLALNICQQLQEIYDGALLFYHPTLLLGIIFLQYPIARSPNQNIQSDAPLLKQWMNTFPQGSTTRTIQQQVKHMLQQVFNSA